MEDLILDLDEGIILQTTDVERYQKNDNYIEVYELYLTNKNLISVYEKSNGMFKKTENVVEKIPLTDIKVVNGKVQIFKKDDNDYGLGLQILFTNGTREHFVFCNNKKELQTWMDSIIEAITGEAPAINDDKKTTNKIGAASAGLMMRFKKVLSTAKEMVEEIKNQTDEFNNNKTEIEDKDTKHEEEQETLDVKENNSEKRGKRMSNENEKAIYCSNCGEKLSAKSKFCNICGTPTNFEGENNISEEVKTKESKDKIQEEQTERKTVYDGKIHKCPNCGEKLKAFDIKCPSCGFEIRDRNASSSVKEFSLKLEKIESNRENKKSKSIFAHAFSGTDNITKTDEQKINLIRSFSIPNNKEDIFEFIILASSNVDFQVYGMGDKGEKNASQRAVSEAWVAKMEQAYLKAKISFRNDPDFTEIKTLYEKTIKKLEHKKKELARQLVWFFGGALAFILVMGLILQLIPESLSRHNRLEYVVEQIEDDIAAGKYDDARNKAYTLTYDEESDPEKHEYWEKKRENLIEQIDEASGEQGSTTQEEDKENEKDKDEDNLTKEETTNKVSKEDLNKFTENHEKANFSKFNSPASENGLGGTRIYFKCVLDKTEILESEGTKSILGYLTDEGGNEWVSILHYVPGVSEKHFDKWVGKDMYIKGVYDGYSGTKKKPIIVMDELLIIETTENVYGMQKVIDG